jgi:glucoamylase
VAADECERAEELARTMEAFAGDSLLLPEQVWDAPDIPGRELFFGEASGSARPLVWAHAEYVKLRRSIEDGRVFDQPPQTVQRYLIEGRASTPYAIWRFNNKIRTMPLGKILRVETLARATVHWGVNEWSDVRDVETVDTGLGVYVADLATDHLASGGSVQFTFFWPDVTRWEGVDFHVNVETRNPPSTGKQSFG